MSVTKASLLGDTFGSNASGTIPVGGIIMWSGTAIPTGWQLCNGSELPSTSPLRPNITITPNLVDKFIVGSGSGYAIGATGGSKDAVLVSHIHTGTTGGQSQDHTHTWGRQDAQNDVNDRPWPASNNDCKITQVQTSGTSNDHTHSFTTSDAKNGSGVVIGASAENANLPPYYALAFIMRVS
jgi:microcystin-dependent protein